MNISKINQILGAVKVRLESQDEVEDRVIEGQDQPLEHHASRMSAAKRRLDNLYSKLTAGRGDDTKVKATGSKRG